MQWIRNYFNKYSVRNSQKLIIYDKIDFPEVSVINISCLFSYSIPIKMEHGYIKNL